MPFPYYQSLSSKKKAIYDKSDKISEIKLKTSRPPSKIISKLKQALKTNNRKQVENWAGILCNFVCEDQNIAKVMLKVRQTRPSGENHELHGLYEWEEGRAAQITVWMKTAKNKQIVAYKSFLRTILHELCHHIDFAHHKLPESFHTLGFFRRESSLFKQLAAEEEPKPATVKTKKTRVKKPKTRQMNLPLKQV